MIRLFPLFILPESESDKFAPYTNIAFAWVILCAAFTLTCEAVPRAFKDTLWVSGVKGGNGKVGLEVNQTGASRRSQHCK